MDIQFTTYIGLFYICFLSFVLFFFWEPFVLRLEDNKTYKKIKIVTTKSKA